MPEYKPLYPWSAPDPFREQEHAQWAESYKENCACARTIEDAIRKGFDGKHLDHTCARSVIDRFGFDRVNWVLANTIQQKDYDGRFSLENKAWAKSFFIPGDPYNRNFCVESHPAVLDGFVDLARKEWQALGLFDSSHCVPDDADQDYTDRVVVLRPDILKDEYKTPNDQLFYVSGGFGARPHAAGRKVFGCFLADGEQTYYNRLEIIGVLKDEHLPAWAAEKLEELREPEETAGPTMGGM